MLHTPKKFRISCYDAFRFKLKSLWGFCLFPSRKTPPGLVVRHLCRAVSSTIVPFFRQPRSNRPCILYIFQEQCLKQCIGSGFHWECVFAISPVALLLCCKNNSVLNPIGINVCQKWLLIYTVDISCHNTEEPQGTDAVMRATNQLGIKDNGKGKPQFSILTCPTITV